MIIQQCLGSVRFPEHIVIFIDYYKVFFKYIRITLVDPIKHIKSNIDKAFNKRYNNYRNGFHD